jgi:predicted dehydrogenase
MKKPIRLGLIGCGGIVQNTHARAYRSLPDTVKVTALADIVPANLQKIGDMFSVPTENRYADYRDMLEHATIDAVTVATPHSFHAEQVIEAAGADVAIISEKPMATTLEEADKIMEAVRRNNVPYTVVHNYIFTAGMRAAMTELDALGESHFGRSVGMGLKPTDFSADHPTPAFAWRASRAKGGGCIIDTSYHEIYSVCTLMRSPVRYVEGRVQTLRFDIDVDDIAMLLCEHENGAVTTVSGAWCVPATDFGWCEMHAENGSLRVRHRQNVKDALRRFTRAEGWKDLELPEFDEAERTDASGHARYFKETFNALADGTELPVSPEMAYQNLAIIEAARQATTERRAIEIRMP